MTFLANPFTYFLSLAFALPLPCSMLTMICYPTTSVTKKYELRLATYVPLASTWLFLFVFLSLVWSDYILLDESAVIYRSTSLISTLIVLIVWLTQQPHYGGHLFTFLLSTNLLHTHQKCHLLRVLLRDPVF